MLPVELSHLYPFWRGVKDNDELSLRQLIPRHASLSQETEEFERLMLETHNAYQRVELKWARFPPWLSIPDLLKQPPARNKLKFIHRQFKIKNLFKKVVFDGALVKSTFQIQTKALDLFLELQIWELRPRPISFQLVFELVA